MQEATAQSSAGAAYKYDAFISYSRKDTAFARALEDALDRYRPPRELPLPQRALNIFRDESDFTGGDYLPALRQHLEQAAKLLVICSPNSRASEKVGEEIQLYAQLRGANNIVSLLLDGAPNEEVERLGRGEKAFSEALVGLLGDPLAADFRGFRPGKDRHDRGLYTNAWLKILGDLYADYGVDRRQLSQLDEKRARARRRAWIAGSLAVMFSLAGLAAVGWYQRNEAVQQRQLAEQRNQRLREAMENLAYDLPVKIEQEGLGLKARQTMYDGVYNALKKLYDNGVQGPELDVPMAYTVLQLAGHKQRAGQLDAAIRDVEMIPERHTMLPAQQQTAEDWQNRLAEAHVQLSDMYEQLGDLAQATQHQQKAFDIRARHAQSTRWDWANMGAHSRQRLAQLQMAHGQLSAARANLEEACHFFAQRKAGDDESARTAVQDWYWCRLNQGDLAEEQGDDAAALRIYRELLGVTATDKEGDSSLAELALRQRLGEILARGAQLQEARAHFDTAVALSERMWQADQADRQLKANSAIVRDSICEALERADQHRSALEHCQLAVRWTQELATEDPDNVVWGRDLEEMRARLADALERTGAGARAREQIAIAYRNMKSLRERYPENVPLLRTLATVAERSGDIEQRSGNMSAAAAAYREAYTIRVSLAARDPNFGKLQEELANVGMRLADALLAAGSRAEAIDVYRGALAAQERLVKQSPGTDRLAALASLREKLNAIAPESPAQALSR